MSVSEHEHGSVLRLIPSMDAFLDSAPLRSLPRALLLSVARRHLAEVRDAVRAGALDEAAVRALFDGGAAAQAVARDCEAARRPRHRRVINATGIVLHTGLGRAPLPAAAQRAIVDAAGYAVVELDPSSGQRNQREETVAELLCHLTGATGALVVNNNAAATTLALAGLAEGREVVVSRGQLVEIGGGFRMPDVMAQAGCRMVEVGTTNRTHLRDFEAAITDATAALLQVHPSNFRMLGFVEQPGRAELVQLGRRHQVAVIDDLGSGLLLAEPPAALEHEPRVLDAVADGAALLCFSGDKLLGGPQCGILLGEREAVVRARSHPLYRAFRCDKLTLAALEATLRIYRDGDPLVEVPTLAMLTHAPDELRARAATLAGQLTALQATVVPTESFAGSGANPARPLPSFGVALPGGERVVARLRAPGSRPAVFARVERDQVLLDLRTLSGEDLQALAALILERVLGKKGDGP